MKASETHTANCLKCGRTRYFLTAESAAKASPYGRTCRARIRAAAITEAIRDFAAKQIEKARELLADGGLVPVRSGVWQAIASDGITRYLVAEATCNCPAGLKGRRCYHTAAARIWPPGAWPDARHGGPGVGGPRRTAGRDEPREGDRPGVGRPRRLRRG